jgi:hypothetical protein
MNVVNRRGPDLFPVMSLVSLWFIRREAGGAAPMSGGGVILPQVIENQMFSLVNKLPIKLNLMPDFFHLLGRGKVR